MSHSENALSIYKKLYFATDETKPLQVHERVSKTIANNENEAELFFKLLEDNTFRANTPCMINSKVRDPENPIDPFDPEHNLAACFVLNLQDTMNSIREMWGTCTKVYEGGGGTGIPLSNLREKDAPISTGGKASGPIKYLEVVQTISETVKSGGKTRRAANLTSFKYNHPDIREYIKCKKTHNFSSINTSVLVTDTFMTDVMNKNWDKEIPLVSPYKKRKVGKISVGELWTSIIETAWESGDPGLLFYDEANLRHSFPESDEVICSNPCGEVLLPPDSCCNLGSINLNNCLIYNKSQKSYTFDYDLLKRYTEIATLFLDNVIDKTAFPDQNFKTRMSSERPIGLGMMGFSDILFKMRIQYGTLESIELFENICRIMTKCAFEYSISRVASGECESIEIPEVDKEHFRKRLIYFGVDDTFLKMYDEHGIRNSTVTSIAPTGSISISADCSYAFEPCFALIWSKKLVDENKTLYFTNELFKEACKEAKIELTPELLQKIQNNKGSCQGLAEIPNEIQEIFVTAHDVGWKKKIEVQTAGQRWITLSISSTCNLPNTASVEDVSEAYILAWKSRLKGITVYRDGCLNTQPVNFGAVDVDEFPILTPMKRPSRRNGLTVEANTPHGKLYLTGNTTKKGRLFEVFIRMGEQGHVTNIVLDALGKVISKSLQYGVPLNALIDTMNSCGGFSFFFKLDEETGKSEQATSVVAAVAMILDYYFTEDKKKVCDDNSLAKCPQCGQNTLVIGGGCRGGSCANPECGYSKCG